MSSNLESQTEKKINVCIDVFEIPEGYYAMITYPDYFTISRTNKDSRFVFFVRDFFSKEEMPQLFSWAKKQARQHGIPHVINLD